VQIILINIFGSGLFLPFRPTWTTFS